MLELSIIMPVFNAEQTLHKAIDSVVNQTFHNWELFLIDDGSSDSSGTICDSYSDSYKNIYSFHQENRGLSSARNVGISKVTGKYLAFIDADDWLEPEYYLKMLSFMEEKSTDLVISGFTREFWKKATFRKNEIVEDVKNRILEKNTAGISYFLNLDFSYHLFIHVWNKLYLRSCIEEGHVRFEENMRFGEDVPFNLKYIKQIKKIGIIKYHGYHYVCQNEKSLTTKWSSDLLHYNCLIYKSLQNFLKDDLFISKARLIENMYLRGCILNIEKAILAKQTFKQVLNIIFHIKAAPETQEILRDAIYQNGDAAEFKIYRTLFYCFSGPSLYLAVYIRIFIKRALRRL